MGRPALRAVSTSSLHASCSKCHEECQHDHERVQICLSWGMAASMFHASSQTRQKHGSCSGMQA